MKANKNKRRNSMDDGDLWLSLSDLAMGGFIIFLIIAVVFILKYSGALEELSKKEKLKKEIAIMEDNVDSLRNVIRSMDEEIDSLVEEINRVKKDTGLFEPLVDFNADSMIEVLPDEGIIRFKTASGKELFSSGSDKMSQEFNTSLHKFLPEFLKVIRGKIDRIDEIRIQGHTDTDCINSPTEYGCYVDNLDLSLRRAQNVLLDIIGHSNFPKNALGLKIRKRITATGYSFSKQLNENGKYTDDKEQMSKDRSRRVEFRVLLKTR